jgi:heme/copper-type cytochrome/quinol oxidase subunit 3
MTEIPYDVKPHPITGVYNAKLGIWLFLASEVMLFGALFSSYVLLRVGAESWPHGYTLLNVPLATLNTFVLIGSSVTVVMAWASLKMHQLGRAKGYLWTTVALAGVFLVVKAVEYGAKFSHHISPATDNFYATYFTITGLHGLHVIGGILAFLILLIKSNKMWTDDPEHFTNRVECCGLYWHFVDLVWIFLFPTLYLL